ncbi:MAG: DUF1501 domain-containing protein [Janthinobacterium lividum]
MLPRLQSPAIYPLRKGTKKIQTTRRGLFALGVLSALGWASGRGHALGSIAIRPNSHGPVGDVLVSIFLRGGVDGLSLIVPHGDDDYYRLRPTLALARPSDRRTKSTERVLDLDGFFGLHPALAPLWPLQEAGQLAIVHACGSGDQTRSHFEAMATMERGVQQETGPASGWLARHLETAPWNNPSPLRAVALGSILPQTLSGASQTTTLSTVADLRLQSPFGGSTARFERTLAQQYSAGALAEAGQEALSMLKTLNHLPTDTSHIGHYPNDDLSEGLRQVSLLIKSGVGLEAACLDHAGYDTHVAQGTSQGILAGRLQSLSSALAAFAADLGPEHWNRTTVVVMSEFGRRAAENSGLGTDHGRAGAMLVLGGHVVGGRVHGLWPGLGANQLEGPGDLKVTTDYRAVLAEIITHRLKNPNASAIFPGLELAGNKGAGIGLVHV